MSWVTKLIGRRRAREAARRLGIDACVENYLSLAREYVAGGSAEEVLRVCTEGLHEHPGDAELTRLADRARTLLHEQRIRALQSDLAIAPRPALWRELCELWLEVGKLAKAEEAAESWWRQAEDGEALLYRARCRAQAFFTDRCAEDGRVAHDLAAQAAMAVAGDDRPLQLSYEIARRCGAWSEARTALAALLELTPGNPDLEQRFRAVQANLADSVPLERALLEVERSGEFQDDVNERVSGSDEGAARPLLQSLATGEGVQGAVYVRGGTALVQGPHGATADRLARGVRDVLQSSRSAARRLGLGQPVEIELEGEFGSLVVLPGERGTAALWAERSVLDGERERLSRLAGAVGGGAQ